MEATIVQATSRFSTARGTIPIFDTLAILRPKITTLTKVRIPETLNLPWARECLIIFPHEVQYRDGCARELQEPFGGGLGKSLIQLGQETWNVVWSGA
jgi:hypothetical protein